MPTHLVRPQSSGWPLVGHDRAVEVLRRSIRLNLLSHAYLFTGAPGVGKRPLAMAFAMTLNCLAEPAEGLAVPDVPCLLCSSCSRIARGDHPDVTEINLQTQAALTADTSGKTTPAKELRIDSIREMQRTVGLSPHSGRWKVFIIGDADKMNDEAANCLLKTLEEPPSQTILMLLADDPAALLPTIYSRCTHVPLRPLARDLILAQLMREWNAEPEQAALLAALSGGRLGWAVGMLRDRNALEMRSRTLEDLAVLSGSTVLERVNAAAKYAKKFTDARPELYTTLDTWEGWWRDVLTVQAGAPELALNADQLTTLASIARRLRPRQAYDALELVQRTRLQLQENVNPRLALEALVLGMP
ncbi:MAG: DNA polymerase III subunit delta' [Chloroflexia bacterium]|jgi:DNA polymerase-3 subunit delta'